MKLDDPVEVIPRTHSVTIRRFRRLGIETIFDFLNYFPFRYENYSLISPIARLQESEIVTIKGTIVSSQNLYLRKGLVIQKAVVADESGKLEVSWYNQPYLLRHFVKGGLIAVAGLAKKFSGQIKLEAKEYDLLPSLESSTVHTGRLIPVYSEKNGLSTKIIREKMFRVLSSLPPLEDPLAAFLSSRKNLVEENKAYREVHFPTTAAELEQARKRLSFDELFFLELSQALVRREWEKTQLRRPFLYQDREKKKLDSFMAGLPFQLTFAQKQAVAEILSDLVLPRPMNRFLQGDVGSGKTVVAAVACYLAHLNGLQSLVMAPTEILALQHFQTLEKLFAKTKLRVALQTGSRKVAKKIIDEPIVVGTHALLEKKVKFRKVGLVVVDEQHRFGVMQRAILKKKGEAAHFLTMTATPIPRTVALILYGQLNLSVLDEMPKGRRPVKTYMVPEQKKKDCYRWICGKIKKDGEQAFIICPLIEESETETMKSLKAAVKEFAYLKTQVFPDCRVGLLHG
ncbi:DEAD/DEAH box helicase, partial [Candidatus Roizmanbacteria bacterium]|nr:DEAD/DEAH box helicase [Candidatus Roizmanbacteria bacterium]